MPESTLIEIAEAIRSAQALANSNDRTAYKHGPVRVWGHLDDALRATLTIYFGGNYSAARKALRVTDEIYNNGENVQYNVDLLENGEIEL